MRKAALALLLSLPMTAAIADDDIGCGVGSILWEGQSGIIAKALGATTNGIFMNQTFGITAGTLGCSASGVITAQHRIGMFAGANMDQLAAEVAAGQGETVQALATLYGVVEADQPAFSELLQANYDQLFDRSDITAGAVLVRLETVLSGSELSHYARS